MGEFIEERLNTCIALGAAAEDGFFLDTITTAGGSRYASLMNGKPYREFSIGYIKAGTDLALDVLSLFNRTWGGFAGFRVKSWDDFSTAEDGVSAPSSTDCVLDLVSPGVYQLAKEYGASKAALASIGRPRRTIFKPIADTVLIGVGGSTLPASQWTADSTTGRVTIVSKTDSINGITKGVTTTVNANGHPFLAGERVNFSAVAGMTQINGLRGTILSRDANNFVVNINSLAFSDYVSGGFANTSPQAGESVTGGCLFDLPCAFDSKFSVDAVTYNIRDVSGLRLVELLNP